jgi:hypothetical protein
LEIKISIDNIYALRLEKVTRILKKADLNLKGQEVGDEF